MNYEVPILTLSRDTIRSYAGEDDWDWVEAHPECVKDILEDAASALEVFVEDIYISNAIADAISSARKGY